MCRVSGLRELGRIDVASSEIRKGGEIPRQEGAPDAAHEEPRDRAVRELIATCREALQGAGLVTATGALSVPSARIGLVLGSSLAASASRECFWGELVEGGLGAPDYADLKSYDVEVQLDQVCRHFGIEGGARLVSNACAAGASSLVIAGDWLRLGRVDVVLAAGFDLLDLHTFAGFRALGALTASALHPFGVERDGMLLSDGFGALVVEAQGHARAAGREPVARLVGYGESADAHNLTQPHPEGLGAVLAMRRALALAGLAPNDIDYLNAHATTTPANDGAELCAMRTVFGDALDEIAVHAVKPALGHSLGGAGAVEAVITALVLKHGRVPPTLGLGELEAEARTLDLRSSSHERDVRYAMTNSFGFGGCNSSLIFAAEEQS